MMGKVTRSDFDGMDFAIGRPHLTMRPSDREYGYRLGVYWSPHGLVDIYWQPPVEKEGRRWDGLTSMSVIVGGRAFHRSWRTAWGDKTIARLAREFADYAATKPNPHLHKGVEP